ncbi:hypothetical protein BX604_4914 [Burkholderia sp. JKS000303]|nr:hypothetical protein BX604_4914 [Burkholderia sp. JKS000303]
MPVQQKIKPTSWRVDAHLAVEVETVRIRHTFKTTSDAIRYLLKLGTDTDRRASQPDIALPNHPKLALEALRTRLEHQESLDRTEWASIARGAHRAYIAPGRNFVSSYLLADVLLAMRALFNAREEATGRPSFAVDIVPQSKQVPQPGESFSTGIDRLINALPAWPDADCAERLSRPLERFFDGKEQGMSDDLIDRALRPYTEALLTLAIRQSNVSGGEPPATETGVDDTDRIARTVVTIEDDGLALTLLERGTSSELMVTFGNALPLSRTLPTPFAIADFFDLVEASADADSAHRDLRTDSLRIVRSIARNGPFTVFDGDCVYHIDALSMTRLASLVSRARRDTHIRSLLDAARLEWGAI